MSAWPAHVQPRMFQCHGQAHQRLRGLQCGCRRKQPSFPEGSIPAQALQYALCPAAHLKLDSNGYQSLLRSYQALRPVCDFLHYLYHWRDQAWLEHCGPEQQWFFQARVLYDWPCAILQKLAGWSLRAPNGGQYIKDRYRRRKYGPRERPRFYHRVFSGRSS